MEPLLLFCSAPVACSLLWSGRVRLASSKLGFAILLLTEMIGHHKL
jgi:hypothetical protein